MANLWFSCSNFSFSLPNIIGNFRKIHFGCCLSYCSNFFISNLSKIRYTEYITLLFYLGLVTLNKAIEKKIPDLVKLGKYE